MKSTDSTGDDATGPTNSANGGHVWTCPFCGKSRLNSSDGESGEANAVAALRTHVFASDGGEHGSRNAFPEDADTDTTALSRYVVEVD